MRVRFVALWLIAACVLMFIVQFAFGTQLVILDRAIVWEEPWRLVTSLFAHADVVHLLSNMFGLGLFGLILEGRVGPRRTLIAFFAAGLLVNVFTPYARSLGASGALFGIIGALALLRPGLIVWAGGVPLPMLLAAIAWAVQDAIGVFIPDGVGHLAHLGGIVIGVALGVYWRKEFGDAFWKSRRRDPTLESALDRWEERYMK